MQPRFDELRVSGFRRLADVRLELRPLSVLVGANGTGKTSVLDVLSLAAQSASGRLASGIANLGGIASIVTTRAESLSVELTMEPGETGLPQVAKSFEQPEEFRKRLVSSTFYHAVDVGP